MAQYISTALILLCGLQPLMATVSDPTPEVGTWSVGNCILAQFAMELVIHPNDTMTNITQTMTVPASAKANADQAQCGKDKQSLQLTWSEPAKNDSKVQLDRTITIQFVQNNTQAFYGVVRFYGMFIMGVWTDNGTVHNSSINFDTGDIKRLMFHTPANKSFLCGDLGDLQLPTNLQYNPGSPPNGIKLANTTVDASKVQFDAFRIPDHSPIGYRSAIDCDYKPNDIVPIAVGVALAVLVIVVLVAYLVGRRKQRQRGYQSV